ncbi:MAG TPA: alanine--tRNA ligase, partial [Chromatiaceae bacterium]|nr:alanine--tRNA ligase [Chromatiaceae bacterium]
NEGRGYVQRRIIRRAIRHGYQLGQQQAFFYRLVASLVAQMAGAYPQLAAKQGYIEHVLKTEEERFADTLEQGLRIFEDIVAGLQGNSIPGEAVFRLYDTYGFPADLTADIARERGLALDMQGFEREMAAQKERARAASQFSSGQQWAIELEGETDFIGYDLLEDQATVIALYSDGEPRDRLAPGETGLLVLDLSPFYAESGGQVGDRGWLSSDNATFEVEDTQKQGDGVICHVGRVTGGELLVGDRVHARVDADRRRATALHHSATHLLHAALRRVLGEHVQQRGSLVDPDRLRFDFSHFEPVSRAQLHEIERLVNREIRQNHMVETRIMDLDDAKSSGAMALFGEKYADQVRVLRMGDFSVELCGGTHVRAVGDIGLFKIVSEGGISSGVRRIEAVAGEPALTWVEDEESRLQRVAELVKGAASDVDDKVAQLVERSRKLEKELEQLKSKLASAAGSDLASQAVDIDGVKVLAAKLDAIDPKSLRDLLDQLKNKVGSGILLLATESDGKVSLIAGVTKDLTARFKAGDLVKAAAEKVGGRGGGRPDMAQAGGTDPAGIPAALELAKEWVQERVASVG